MTIKTNTDLRRQYFVDTGHSWCDDNGNPTIDYAEWTENKIIAVERAWTGWSREAFRK